MRIRKLDTSFYRDHTHLKEVLDNHDGDWNKGKTRGYGIVVISVSDLKFAVPLRSHIKHTSAYVTVKSHQPGIHGKGLDFTKALLITKDSYVSQEVFKIPSAERKILRSKQHHIREKFEKYVVKYIESVKVADQNVLSSSDYRFSTLMNYHSELGL